MRKITEIIIHCSATKEGHPFFAADIDRWHKAQGWSGIGYHYVIDIDGKVETGRAEYQTGAHAKGHNANSIGICYIGGLDINGKPKDTRTPEQRKSLAELVARLKVKYPKATVHGHNEFANKACPCFDAKEEYKSL